LNSLEKALSLRDQSYQMVTVYWCKAFYRKPPI